MIMLGRNWWVAFRRRWMPSADENVWGSRLMARTSSWRLTTQQRSIRLGSSRTCSWTGALARSQDEDTTNYENSLRQRIESIVSSVVGAGHAEKEQVQLMVRRLLPGCTIAKADAADALAVAICHAHHLASSRAIAGPR